MHLSYWCTSRASLVLTHPSRAPLLSCTQLVHHSYSCTHLMHLYSLAPISCTQPVHHSFSPSSTNDARVGPSVLLLVYHSAPLRNLVHHHAPLRNLVHHCVISCTSRAPLCSTRTTLVHPSQASSTVVALPAAWPSDPPLKKLPQHSCTTQILIIATVNIVEILS